ncbi:MAG: hypothetical protein K2M55_05820, partial [Muribaculaceae bacterium]|nr:hypothetical protein [Muribaculaceae bacterium]
CSGLGYSGHETTAGYLDSNGAWYSSYRPDRGGGWNNATASNFLVSNRYYYASSGSYYFWGFRLAL